MVKGSILEEAQMSQKISFKQCIRLVSTYHKYKFEVVDYAVTRIQIR